ncbi:MAG: hypothetical protein ABI728_01295 [Betaproteobacteria bacterium]
MIAFDVVENSTRLFSAVLLTETGSRFSSADCVSLTLTLYNRHDRAIVNSRDALDVLNTNGGTLDTQGNFTFEFTPLDTAILTATLEYENRVALFELVYSGTRQIAHEVEFRVTNAYSVP